MNNNEYNRLLELKDLINNNSASKTDKQEYMEILFRNGNISEQQYDKFLSDQNSDEIVKAALTIGGVVLATWLISKLFD